jgi:hypothetical protein
MRPPIRLPKRRSWPPSALLSVRFPGETFSLVDRLSDVRACDFLPVLFLATLGAALTPLGWWLGELCFVPSATFDVDPQFAQVVQANRSGPHIGRFRLWRRATAASLVRCKMSGSAQPDIIQPVFRKFVDPVARLFDARLSCFPAGYYAFGTVWMLLIWGFYGGAITRIAVVKLGREEHISLGEALGHVRRKLLSYFFSPLFPLLGVVLLACRSTCWAADAVGHGGACRRLAWLFVLLSGLGMAVLLLGTCLVGH